MSVRRVIDTRLQPGTPNVSMCPINLTIEGRFYALPWDTIRMTAPSGFELRATRTMSFIDAIYALAEYTSQMPVKNSSQGTDRA